MASSRRYTQDELALVVGALKQSDTIVEALRKLNIPDGWAKHINERFAHAGLNAPSTYLRTRWAGGRKQELGESVIGYRGSAPIIGLDYDEDGPTEPRRDTMPSSLGAEPCRMFVDRKPEPIPLERSQIDKVVVFFPDLHAGYTDEAAFSCGLEIAQDIMSTFAPEHRMFVQLGDLLDNDAISPHPKHRPNKLSFKDELELGRELVNRMSAIDCGERMMCMGNHDNWTPRYIARHAPELDPFIDLPTLLGLREHNWKVVPYNKYALIGRTRVSHEFGRCGGNAAQAGLQSRYGKVFGHTHRLAVHYAGMIDDTFRISAMLGWMGRYDVPEYAQKAQFEDEWCHGMGYGYLDTDGFLWLTPVPIVQGRAVVNGIMYGRKQRLAA